MSAWQRFQRLALCLTQFRAVAQVALRQEHPNRQHIQGPSLSHYRRIGPDLYPTAFHPFGNVQRNRDESSLVLVLNLSRDFTS